jgi:tetratricopeptide (TPR) repeat protein
VSRADTTVMEPAEHPSYGPSYLLQMMATLGIWVGLSRWGGLTYQGQQYEVILLWMFLFRPLSTLIHELGHAAAVKRLARRPAEVVVGASSPSLKGRLGQISISFSPVPVLGSQVAGICRYRPDGVDWRTRAWISLAGPAAKVLELLVVLALLPVWSHAGVIVRDVCAVGAAMLALNVVTNLMPTPLVRDKQGRVVLGRDGWNAREAFLNARAAVPVLGAAAAAASLPEVEASPPVPAAPLAPAAPLTQAAPAAGAASAPRTLAEIWSNHEESVAQTAALPTAKSASEQLTRGDFAQRALADIWSAQPDDPAADLPPAVHGSASSPAAVADPLELVVPESVDAQLQLAASHLKAGRIAQAIPLLEAAVIALHADATADSAGDGAGGCDGDGEEGKLASARGTLANAYLATRRPQLAIGLYDLLLADPSPTITESTRLAYRIKLAQAYRAAGKASTAIDQLEALVAELDTAGEPDGLIDAQVELATTYVVAHRIKDGVSAYEVALPHVERVLGTDDRKSLSLRVLLARAYQEDGQTQLATRTYRNLVADAERALGPNDKLTRQAHGELTALLRNQPR